VGAETKRRIRRFLARNREATHCERTSAPKETKKYISQGGGLCRAVGIKDDLNYKIAKETSSGDDKRREEKAQSMPKGKKKRKRDESLTNQAAGGKR